MRLIFLDGVLFGQVRSSLVVVRKHSVARYASTLYEFRILSTIKIVCLNLNPPSGMNFSTSNSIAAIYTVHNLDNLLIVFGQFMLLFVLLVYQDLHWWVYQTFSLHVIKVVYFCRASFNSFMLSFLNVQKWKLKIMKFILQTTYVAIFARFCLCYIFIATC